MTRLLAIDPGRSKCGLVLCELSRHHVIDGLVLPVDDVLHQIERWSDEEPISTVLLGNGTGSADWEQRLRPLLPVELVEERGTTLRARARYWTLRPPAGLAPAASRRPAPAAARSRCLRGTGDARGSPQRQARLGPIRSETGTHREGVVASRFQVVIGLHEKAEQGILNQGPPQRRLHMQFTAIKQPAEFPGEAPGLHLALQALLLKALTQDPQMGRGDR